MELQTLDLMIFAMCVVAATGGYRIGFVARVTSWAGIALGAVAAWMLLPSILRTATDLSDLTRLGVVALTTVSGVLLGQMLGMLAGAKLSANLPAGRWREADKGFGVVGGVLGVLIAMWLVLPIAADVPGWMAQQSRSSVIAQNIDQWAPPPPDSINTVRRLVGSESFRPVFEGITPAPDTGPPPASVSLPADVVSAVTRSTIRVEGVACRRTQNGSGFAIGNGLFVTNAHVVAGERETTIYDHNGTSHDADVVLFDPDRDLAVLRATTLRSPGLEISEHEIGESGAVFGHPGGIEQLVISPAAVQREVLAQGKDLYDESNTERSVLILAANLRQGDSGGALVNTSGQVIGVAFAIAPDNPDTAYALSSSELRAFLDQTLLPRASTGPCLTD